MLGMLLKKTITIFTLVDPVCMIPLFLAACIGADAREKEKFARSLGVTVTLTLLASALAGGALLSLMGISIGSMGIAGGLIALIFALAMVIGHELDVKIAVGDAVDKRSVVPLGIPLLAGPGCMAYMIGQQHGYARTDWALLIGPSVIVGVLTWLVFHTVSRAQGLIRQSTLNVFERIGGFLLAALSIEMIVTGVKASFPNLVG